MRVYVTNGPRNGLDIGRKVDPCFGSGDSGCWAVFMPFLKPLMPQTHTVPGFKLGPTLPTAAPVALRLRILRVEWSERRIAYDMHTYLECLVKVFTGICTCSWHLED